MITSRRLSTLLAAAALSVAAAAPAHAGPLETMRVPEAIAAAGPLTPAPVLVADTGLDLDHPGFAGKLFSLPQDTPAPDPDGTGNAGTVKAGAAGWDMLGPTAPGTLKPDADPSDPTGGSGHGTAVAGVLGGVAPNARFVALRTCWDGDECYQYVQAAAIEWAAARGTKVVSMSWLSGPLENELRDAIRNHPEMLFVAIPSGNGGAYDADGEEPRPCGLDAPNVLCVSTASASDGLDCGAYGPRSVDVAVPTRGFTTTVNGGGYTTTGCATSFAAPAAAGVATLLFGVNPAATGAMVRDAIVGSARPVAAWTGKSVSGGIVDAAAAVQRLRTGASPAPVPGPLALRVTRSGRSLQLTANAAAQLTGVIKRDGRVRRRVDIPLAAGQAASVALPNRRGRYRVALTATGETGQQAFVNRSFRVSG
jgi:subtilisin family serine protease